jgi:iron complex outermembrane receptor protein
MVAFLRPAEDAARIRRARVLSAFLILLALSLVFSETTSASAQDPPPIESHRDSTLTLTPLRMNDSTAVYLAPTLEVSARRRRRQEILDREGGFASVILRSSWAGGLESAASVLSDAVGVTVKESGGLGSYSSASIRGCTSAQSPVFLDGVPLAGPANGSVNLTDLPLESLQRIEVYRGAAPLVLGGAGLGGAIHLVSAKGPEESWTRTTAGSYGTYEIQAGSSQRTGNWTLLGRGRYLESNGNFSYQFDNRTPYNPRDDFEAVRRNNDVTAGGGMLSAYRAGDRWDLQISELLDGREYGLPGRDLQAKDARSSSFTHHLRAALISSRARSGRLRKLELFHRIDQQGFDDRNGELGLVREQRRDLTQSVGLNALGSLSRHGRDIWRLETRWARLQSKRLWPSEEKGAPQTRLTLAAALQPEFRAFDQRLSLSPGARIEYHHDRFHGVPPLGNYGLPNGPREFADTWAHTYQLGLRYLLGEHLILKSNLGEYQRVPTLIERFGNRGGVIGNPDLVPEVGTNRDLGLVFTQHAASRRLMISVFHNDSSELITFVRNSQRTATAQNIGAAEIKGVEADLQLSRLGPLTLGFNGTWLETRDRSDNATFQGQPLPGRPGYQLRARVAIEHGFWRVGYEFSAMGNNTLDRNGREKIPSRALHEIWTRLHVLGVNLDARVENLTDNRQLFDLYGWPLPGRRFLLSLGIGGKHEAS